MGRRPDDLMQRIAFISWISKLKKLWYTIPKGLVRVCVWKRARRALMYTEKGRNGAYNTTTKRDDALHGHCQTVSHLRADGNITGKKKEDTHKVPQCAKRRNTRFLATLHNLRIAIVVRRDENDWAKKKRCVSHRPRHSWSEMQNDNKDRPSAPKE